MFGHDSHEGLHEVTIFDFSNAIKLFCVGRRRFPLDATRGQVTLEILANELTGLVTMKLFHCVVELGVEISFELNEVLKNLRTVLKQVNLCKTSGLVREGDKVVKTTFSRDRDWTLNVHMNSLPGTTMNSLLGAEG